MDQTESQLAEADVAKPGCWRWLARFVLVTLYLAAMFAACLWLYSRNNEFPVSFHPDEPGKVEQVIGDVRNFRHPQLMLEATTCWCRWAGVNMDDAQAVAVAGRQVSAFFGASAATLLALTVYLVSGGWGLVIGSVMLGLWPELLSHSHYMKEDVSLLFGLAVTILASRVIWIGRRWWTRLVGWTLIAGGCALATSGKYVGAVSLALPVALIFIAPGFRWYRPMLRVALFVPLFVLALGAINHRALNPEGLDVLAVAKNPAQWQILLNPSFLEGLQGEAEHSSSEHMGLTANRPNTYNVRTAISQSWPVAFVLMCAMPIVLVVTRKRGWGWETLILLFMGLTCYVLSYSIIMFPRYALPVTMMVFLLAAVSLSRGIAGLSSRRVLQATGGVVVTAGLVALYLPVCLDYTLQFGKDSRFAVADWIVANLPQGATVFADGYSEVGGGPTGVEQRRADLRVRSHFIIGQMPGLPNVIQRSGEAYYVLCDLSYDRYFEPSMLIAPGYQEENNRFAERFYRCVIRTKTPIKVFAPTHNMKAFTNPLIQVYKLSPADLKSVLDD